VSGRSLVEYLRTLCSDLDEGRPLRRFEWPRALAALAVPVAIGLAGSGAGCAHEDCGDGVDNDRDGLVDLADPDCFGVAPPANAEYAAPPPDNVMPVPAPGCAIINPPLGPEPPTPLPDDLAPSPVGAYGAPPVQAYRAPFPSEPPAPDVKPPDPATPPATDPSQSVPLYGLPPSR
jgi:hypothetical protein